MDTGLQDRVVLVTGASKGIGAAIARAYGHEGARVAITYRDSPEKAEKVAADVVAAGGAAFTVRMDLEEPATVEAAVGAVVEHWGGVDVLVANAVRWGGDGPPDPSIRFEHVPLADWQAMIDANVLGAAAQVKAELPSMRARGWGRIVLISSNVAEEGAAELARGAESAGAEVRLRAVADTAAPGATAASTAGSPTSRSPASSAHR